MIPDDVLMHWTPTEPAEARALVRAVLARAKAADVALPAAPAEPTNCCDSGCIGCVWEGFYSEVTYWRDEAMLRWAD